MFLFLTVLQALIAASLVGVILMQRSEGGALGVGGSPGGLMSARGAGDFLTRVTTILAVLFVTLSIILAMMAAGASSSRTIDQTLDRSGGVSTEQTAPALPSDDPLSAATADEAGVIADEEMDPLAPAAADTEVDQ
jgi:preprotein translocase subunit SecG